MPIENHMFLDRLAVTPGGFAMSGCVVATVRSSSVKAKFAVIHVRSYRLSSAREWDDVSGILMLYVTSS